MNWAGLTLLAACLGAVSPAVEEQEYDLQLCRERPSHWRNNQHDYLFSGLLGSGLQGAGVDFPSLKGRGASLNYPSLPWEEARRFCRRRCMDLVSLESISEQRLVRRKLEEYEARSVWTSGHLCDSSVSEQCYTDPGVQPRRVNGWFWTGSERRLAATNSTPRGWGSNPWDEESNQPDNSGEREGEEEACLAMQVGGWHDLRCSLPREWLCEDSTDLLTKAGLNQPIVFG